MALKARKNKSWRAKRKLPDLGRATDGSVCLIEEITKDNAGGEFAIGTFRMTNFFDHGAHCGHNHGDPEIFGPFESRADAIAYARANYGVQQLTKVS